LPTALATDHGPTLVTTLLEELRARRIVCPPLAVMERLAGTTPQAVVDYHPSAEARARVAALIAREKEGSLAPEEKAELDHIMDLEHILRMAKARARQILTSGP
jgi:hypothetical protein